VWRSIREGKKLTDIVGPELRPVPVGLVRSRVLITVSSISFISTWKRFSNVCRSMLAMMQGIIVG